MEVERRLIVRRVFPMPNVHAFPGVKLDVPNRWRLALDDFLRPWNVEPEASVIEFNEIHLKQPTVGVRVGCLKDIHAVSGLKAVQVPGDDVQPPVVAVSVDDGLCRRVNGCRKRLDLGRRDGVYHSALIVVDF
jgi:hypothetical protein